MLAGKCYLFLFLSFTICATDEDTTDKSFIAYDFLYNEGVSKYLEENWEGCVKNLEQALKGWHYWNDQTIRCRRDCSQKTDEKELLSANMSEEDRFFERTLHSTLCVVKCKKDVFGPQKDRIVESEIIDNFKMRKPYDYLQLCYHQLGRTKDAADAAATVLAVQPDNEVMTENLNYYLKDGDFQPEDVLNLELKEYGKEYLKGTLAYNKNDFDLTITHMEKSLELFYEEYENCRFLCENPFDQGWYPDFVSSIANHYTFTLRCKRRCFWQLSDLFGEIDDNFLPSHFDYLQYSYFQKGETAKACEALASFLTISPEDEVQNRNKEFYLSQDDVTMDMFNPREEVVALMQRENFEEQLLQFIENDFAFLTDEFWDEEDDTTTKIEEVGDGEAQVSNSSSVPDLDTSTVVLSTDKTANPEL